MTETHRKSIWGFVWTIIWTIVHFVFFVCGLTALLGKKVDINGMILSRKIKNGWLCSGLIAAGGGIVLLELIVLMSKKNFLDQKAYLKLLPIIIGGLLFSGGEYLLEKAVLKGKIEFPFIWVLHVVIYFSYLFIEAFRPWRQIKMLAGINSA